MNPDFPAGVYLVQVKADHTLGIVTKLPGTTLYKPAGPNYDINIESDPLLAINSVTNQAITRTFSVVNCNGCWYPQISENNNIVNLATGAVSSTSLALLEKAESSGYGFYIRPDGSIASGWKTSSASGTFDKFNYFPNFEVAYNANNAGMNRWWATVPRFGEYVGDGMWLSVYGGATEGGGGGFGIGGTIATGYLFLDVGTASTVQAYKGSIIGQFMSPDSYADAEITFKLSMDSLTLNTKLAGMSFRMTDPRNRYALEADGANLYLSKYVGGARTVLGSIAYPFQPKTTYAFKIQAQGDRIQVFMNGVPYFDKTDAKFAAGKFGPFSDKPYVSFGEITRKELSEDNVQWLTNYAIWENGTAQAEVRYSEIAFDDPEKDPRAGNNRWSVQHTPKFLNNQGLSVLNGQTLEDPMLQFDKVGNYRVMLKAQDDPHPQYRYPSSVFADYRKWSNEYWQIITVHRRPIAKFTLSINSTDHTVVWDDQSYDPDRWQSPAVYDTEATGMNYKTTRGITDRRYYYISPTGVQRDTKLIAPGETGVYKVGLSVKDEYGAWSYWEEQEIEIETPVKDDPPTPGFTLSKTTLKRGEVLTITSTAKDKEDGPAAHLPHQYFIRNATEGGAETLRSDSRGTWTASFDAIGVMEVRQVVCDSKGQCAQSARSVTVVNRAPTAKFDWTPKPVYEGDAVALTNQSTDPDNDPLTYVWQVSGPNGFAQSGTSKHFAIAGSGTNNRPGVYRVTLTVEDPQGAVSTAAHDIVVHELGIQGMVRHTADWEDNRLRYNDRYPERARSADWFWAGEAFVLAAEVTDTGSSATKPLAVEASAPHDLFKELTAEGAERVRWQGLLRSQDAGAPLSELPQGPLTFTFTVRYSNGVVKTAQATVQLKDTIDSFVQVHRVQ